MLTIDNFLLEKGLKKEDILSINKNNLDNECINHPQIYEIISEFLSYTEGERDSLKLDKEEMYAQKAIEYRLKHKEEKLSDPKIEQLVLTDVDFKIISRKYLELKLKADLIKNLKESLDKKTKMLDHLVYLFNSQYFVTNVGKASENVQEIKLTEKRKLVRNASLD